MTRKCGFCGSEFIPCRTNSLYCSRKCGKKSEYFRHRERYIQSSQIWYSENLEQARKSRKEYYWKDPEKFRGKTKEYWDARREEKRHKDRIYKDKIRHNGRRSQLIETMGLRCSMCNKIGNEFGIITHHLIHDDHDLQILLCRSCHAKLHGKIHNNLISRESPS